ncbi:MAG: TldD/PmbA family protein [Chloroflexi bacterium]|nr:TldD/PmbA family protein [Chloroflexota bacterium]
MRDIAEIGRSLAEALKRYPADHIEAHLEESQATRISYRGRELESVDQTVAVGGNIRAMVKGGWGFASFNAFDDLPARVEAAVKQAALVGREKTQLAQIEPVVEVIPLEAGRNPAEVPLADKKQQLDEYLDIIWRTPQIRTSTIGYGDGYRRYIYLNSAGSFIEQTRADITLRLTAVATADGEVQQAGFSVGSRGDFSAVRGLQQQVMETAGRAVALLSAPHVKGGEYTVVLDPILAGVFVHEAFGHLSESDFVYENEQMRQLMTLGKEFGSPELNVVDSALVPGLRGSFKYDDEGVPASKTYLIREGKLVGRLHSRETAGKMNELPTGNARAINFQHPPIVRMTNTYIEPRGATFEDIIGDIKEGVYARNWYGGTTSMEMFTFSAGETYMIRNGKLAEMVRPVVLTGNVFTTLKNIDAIGSDLDMNQGGGCGKAGQSPLPVSNGSPHIRVSRCLVGGR